MHQPKICFHIPASPTDNFYSQVAMFRMALDTLGGVYKNAHIVLTLGDNEITPLPEKWKPFFGDTIKLNWADPQYFRLQGFGAQGDARWKYNHDQYDIVIFCDADTLLIRPIDDVVARMQHSPAAMGIITHYPFPLTTEESNHQIWAELADKFVKKPIDFKYRHTLVSEPESPSASCPFYVNFGFVVMTPQIIKTIESTFFSLRPQVAAIEKIKYPAFSGQISLTLSLLVHDIPTHELGLRYNFPNDPVADRLHPEELEDIRLIHYLRTDTFDRQTIFTTEDAFNKFLALDLDGSNKIFQDYVRKLTNGQYPFDSTWAAFHEESTRDDMTTKSNQVTVVLGMHRGGTSAIARSLEVLGVGLGDNLYPPAEDNPTGFWEDRDCIAINEELLGHMGSEYDRLGLAWNFDKDDPSIQHLYAKAIRLVSEGLSRNRGMWGVKDPRMCRLLGFWKRVFEACHCKVNYIIALRDPISVAESLKKRNHIPFEKSYLLWIQHMVPAILDSDSGARLVVSYDALLESPEKQVIRIANHLGIAIDTEHNQSLRDFSTEFLNTQLRHSRHILSEITSKEHMPEDTIRAYDLLLRAANDEISVDSDEVQNGFEQIQSNLEAYSPAFDYANFLEQELEGLDAQPGQKEAPEQDKNLAPGGPMGKVQLMINLADRDAQIAALSAQLSKQEQTYLSQLAEKDRAYASQLAEKDRAHASQFAEKDLALQNLSLELEKKDEALQTLSLQLANSRQELMEMRSSRAWKLVTLLIRARLRWAPPNSTRAKILRHFVRVISPLFRSPDLKLELNTELVRSSELFDETWYLANSPDIDATKIDPAMHYTRFGGFEGRDPGPQFSSAWYLATYPDVRKARLNPLVHYLKYGKAENRLRKPEPIAPPPAPVISESEQKPVDNEPVKHAIEEVVNYKPLSDESPFMDGEEKVDIHSSNNQPFKIVLVVHQFFPEYSSGTEVLTYETAKALQKQGHHVIVFTGSPSNAPLKDYQRFDRYVYNGIRVERFHHGFMPMGDQSNTMEMEYYNRLFEYYFGEFLKHEKPDVVHFFHLSRLSASPIDVCKEFNVPTVLTPTDFWFICHTSHLRLPDNQPCAGPDRFGVNCLRHVVALHQFRKVNLLFQRLPDWVIAILIFFIRHGFKFDNRYSPYVRALANRRDYLRTRMNLVDKVVVPTEVMLSSLTQNGLDVERTVAIPYGLNLSYLYNTKRPEPSSTLRLGYIGTLYEHKGVHVLVEAVKKLERKPVELYLYGKLSDFPDYVESLKNIIQDDTRIKFCGTFPNKEIGTIFSGLDALVIPSLWHENAPLVLYSAQAAGCPVIASNKAGMAEIIEHGKNGLLFEAGNVQELSALIEQLLDDPSLLQAMSANAKRPLSIDEYAVKLLEIYDDLIEREKAV